jgi:hypothetical protein
VLEGHGATAVEVFGASLPPPHDSPSVASSTGDGHKPVEFEHRALTDLRITRQLELDHLGALGAKRNEWTL